MLKNKIYFITIAIAFLIRPAAFGQLSDLFKKRSDSYSTVGIGGGSSHYFGDLSPYRTFYYAMYSNVRWNGTLNYQVHLNPRFSARAALSYIRIFGNDATYGWERADDKVRINRLRNLHFRNDMLEFTAMGLYTFIPLEQNKNSPLQWSPYMGIGIGLASNNPKARGSIQDENGNIIFNADGVAHLQDWTHLRSSDRNETSTKIYSSIVPVFPISLGIKTQLNQNWILSLEGSLRFSFSDYLDDVSGGNYTTTALSYRADEDYYALTGKPRTADFKKALGNPTAADIYPSVLARSEVDPNGLRGSRGRLQDTYILTQITLNYIITSRVKCPPLQ